MKSQVCKIAYHILKTNPEITQSEAMKKAWTVVKLREAMKTNDCVSFTFIKADGTERQAHGTLRQCHLPHSKTTDARPKPITLISYFDLDKMVWRSFKAERIKLAA